MSEWAITAGVSVVVIIVGLLFALLMTRSQLGVLHEQASVLRKQRDDARRLKTLLIGTLLAGNHTAVLEPGWDEQEEFDRVYVEHDPATGRATLFLVHAGRQVPTRDEVL